MDGGTPPVEPMSESESVEVFGPIIVSGNSKRKKGSRTASTDKTSTRPRNLFSDQTAKRLLQWLKGEKKPVEKILSGMVSEPLRSKPPQDVQEELAEAIREKLCPWLVSILTHSALLLVLALIFLPGLKENRADILFFESNGLGGLVQNATGGDPSQIGHDPTSEEEVVIVQNALLEVSNPLADLPQLDETPDDEGVLSRRESGKNPVGISLSGREPGNRVNLIGKQGGSGATDLAVVNGLRWLADVQRPDGGWSLTGPFRNAAYREKENRNAATALALLAFQGFGVTPTSKHPRLVEFSRAVANGWDWLKQQQNPSDGCFFQNGTAHANDRFYTHGLCTIALCEMLAMTADETFREPARKAVDYCIRMQSVSGGWRYRPDPFGSDSDVSVTGWILMALKSGQMAGLDVPRETFERISDFLDSVSRDDGSRYLYRNVRGENPLRSMTAEALLCRELLGWKQDDTRLERGIRHLVLPENLPDFETNYKRDVYYWYYASQAIHHYGGEPWRIWNEKMREELTKHQEKSGAEAGSWNPLLPTRDEWGSSYGRLYTTCLSICVLEVYYRHLRIYD